ncbi:hypothetical protein Tco_1512864 [Tanacetum coccineum]
MSTLTFANTHKMVAFLEKPAESDGFHEIINFLNANQISYALTINPTIYTSCIQQFWTTAKAKTVNGVRQIQALIDKKKLIITETSIMSGLHLEDAGGTDCLPTTTIFEELARMGRKQRKDTAVTQEETQQDDSVPTPSNNLPLSDKAKDAQAKEIADLKKRVQKLERKKEIKTYRIKKTKENWYGRSDDAELFDINDLHGDEVDVDMLVGEKHKQSAKEREVNTSVEDSAAPTTIKEITLAQTLIQIKAAKLKVVTTAATTTTTTRPKARRVVVQEPSEFRTPQESQPSKIKEKAKQS